MSVSGQLRTVQALRAIAALLVMMGHLRTIEARQSGATEAGLQPFLSDLWINGASGVDLFFVISGFIMVWVAGETAPGAKAAGRFALARAVRIYPLWWLFAGLTAVYFLITYGVPWDAAQLDQRGLNGAEYLIKSAFLIPQDWFPVLNVGWTLVHEMYFYVVFALLLFLPVARRGYAMILWGALVITLAAMGLSDFHAGTVLELATHPMTLEFLMGAGVAYLIRWGRFDFGAAVLGIGLVWFAAAFALFPYFQGYNADLGWYRTAVFGVPSAFILYGLVQLERHHNFGRRVPDALVRIGDWSYALYLCHILVLSAVGRVWFALFERNWFSSAGFIIAAITAAICTSALAYHLYERPIIRLGKKRIGGRAITAPPSP